MKPLCLHHSKFIGAWCFDYTFGFVLVSGSSCDFHGPIYYIVVRVGTNNHVNGGLASLFATTIAVSTENDVFIMNGGCINGIVEACKWGRLLFRCYLVFVDVIFQTPKSWLLVDLYQVPQCIQGVPRHWVRDGYGGGHHGLFHGGPGRGWWRFSDWDEFFPIHMFHTCLVEAVLFDFFVLEVLWPFLVTEMGLVPAV